MKQLEDLQRRLSEGRLDRREFIKRSTALGLSGAIPAVILAEEAQAQSRNQGGRLRQGLNGGSTSDTLFGVLGAGGTHQRNVQWQLLNNLTAVTADNEVVGELAESWEPSADAKDWMFKVRKGVEFHNGKTLEAEDIIHSLNQHRGEDSKSTGKGLFAIVDDIKADGKDTVIFGLSSGSADFPFILSDYHFPIAPAGSMDADWEKGIGTGPFTLVEWNPGVRALTKRNPNYFKENRPYFDEVETLMIDDVSARTSALQTGAIDHMNDPELRTIDRLSGEPGLEVHEVGGTRHFNFPMLMDHPPFDNLDVRTALKYAIDREAILNALLRGHGYLGNDHPIAKIQRFFASELPQREYDPDKAKFHLKKAGHASLDITLWAGEVYTGGVDSAILYQEHASKAGINMEVKRVPSDGYWSEIWNVKPFCVSTWQGRPTEDLMFTLAYSADSSWNETHWNHERFEQLLREARAELDSAKRREMYVEMQRLIRDEGGLVAPVFANTLSANSTRLRVSEKLSGVLSNDGEKNTENWSFA